MLTVGLATQAPCVYSRVTLRTGAVMSKRKRTLLAIVLVELLLAGIWFYLAGLGAAHPERVAPGFQQTVGSTMGAAMGAFLGLGFILFLMAAKRDRER